MSDKCPKCGAAANHFPDVNLHGKPGPGHYESTAAEQLKEKDKYYIDGIRDDMVRAGLDPRGTVGLAQVHLLVEKIREQEQQLTGKENEADELVERLIEKNKALADKEREIKNYRGFFEILGVEKGDKEIGDATKRIQAKFDELTAANAVVEIANEMHDKAGKGQLDGMTETHLYLKLGTALKAWRKLKRR